jgi:hypothetical protein
MPAPELTCFDVKAEVDETGVTMLNRELIATLTSGAAWAFSPDFLRVGPVRCTVAVVGVG